MAFNDLESICKRLRKSPNNTCICVKIVLRFRMVYITPVKARSDVRNAKMEEIRSEEYSVLISRILEVSFEIVYKKCIFITSKSYQINQKSLLPRRPTSFSFEPGKVFCKLQNNIVLSKSGTKFCSANRSILYEYLATLDVSCNFS